MRRPPIPANGGCGGLATPGPTDSPRVLHVTKYPKFTPRYHAGLLSGVGMPLLCGDEHRRYVLNILGMSVYVRGHRRPPLHGDYDASTQTLTQINWQEDGFSIAQAMRNVGAAISSIVYWLVLCSIYRRNNQTLIFHSIPCVQLVTGLRIWLPMWWQPGVATTQSGC